MKGLEGLAGLAGIGKDLQALKDWQGLARIGEYWQGLTRIGNTGRNDKDWQD